MLQNDTNASCSLRQNVDNTSVKEWESVCSARLSSIEDKDRTTFGSVIVARIDPVPLFERPCRRVVLHKVVDRLLEPVLLEALGQRRPGEWDLRRANRVLAKFRPLGGRLEAPEVDTLRAHVTEDVVI